MNKQVFMHVLSTPACKGKYHIESQLGRHLTEDELATWLSQQGMIEELERMGAGTSVNKNVGLTLKLKMLRATRDRTAIIVPGDNGMDKRPGGLLRDALMWYLSSQEAIAERNELLIEQQIGQYNPTELMAEVYEGDGCQEWAEQVLDAVEDPVLVNAEQIIDWVKRLRRMIGDDSLKLVTEEDLEEVLEPTLDFLIALANALRRNGMHALLTQDSDML